MKYFLHALFLLIFIVIQPTLLGYIEVLGVRPNLFLIYIIIISCSCMKREGAIVGFFFGLFLDLFIGAMMGLNAVLMMALSVGISDFCEKYIRKNSLLTVIIIVLVTTFLYEFVYYIIAFLGDLDFGGAILKVIIPEAIYSMLVAIPLYCIIPKQESEQL